MRKLLFFALAAIFSIQTQAQSAPTIIKEQPAGTAVNYKRISGYMLAIIKNKDTEQAEITTYDLAQLAENKEGVGDLVVVTDADGKTVYIKYALSYATCLKGDKLNAWIKGTKEGNTITIPSGQFLIYGKADDGEYGLQVGYMELIDGKFTPVDGDIKYIIDGYTIKLDDTMVQKDEAGNAKIKILAGYWSDNRLFFCGDALTVGTNDPAGVKSVVTDTNKDVVNETYFDLSGRKLSKIGRGLTIKTVRYTDGTTKSVKVVNTK